MPSPSLLRAVYAQEWEWAAGFVSAWFGVQVSAEWLAAACEPLREIAREPSGCLTPHRGSDASLLVWLKSRLASAGYFAIHEDPAPAIELSTVLHVGFLFLDETPEMLERLTRDGPIPTEVALARMREVDTARSKLFRTHLIPRPIDAVAWLVAPPPDLAPGDRDD